VFAGVRRQEDGQALRRAASERLLPVRMERLAVCLAVQGEEPDGVGVGVDGPGLLFSASRGAAEASVEGEEVPSWQRTAPGCGLWVRHGSSHQGVVERLATGSVLRLAE